MNTPININTNDTKINYDIKSSASFLIDLDFLTNVTDNFSFLKINELSKKINREFAYNEILIYIKDLTKAIHIEASIFEFSLMYTIINNILESFIPTIYQEKLQHILNNLNPNSCIKNDYLLYAIMSNAIEPQKIAFLKPEELFPKQWKFCIRKKNLREYKKNNIAATDMYKCFKCGERKCKVYQQQIRSADEPMTTFVTCLICYNTFKF